MNTMIELEGEHKFWIVELLIEELFNTVSLLSNYSSSVESIDEQSVVLDDDKVMFSVLLNKAKDDAWLKLVRMSKDVPGAMMMTGDSIRMRFNVSCNHDDNVLNLLGGFIQEYVIYLILKYWYETNNLTDEAMKYEVLSGVSLDKVLTVVHYRKKAVRRPVNPVF